MRAVLDTSVLIGGEGLPAGIDTAISTVSVAELHFGLLVAQDDDTRALRSTRLGLVEARYPDPLPLDDRVAREWGRLQAAVANRGGKPRTRNADLAIAATAIVNKAVLVTNNLKDFAIVEDLVEVRAPAQLGA
ncbi:MAG TPA: PIN domain-containing protein [Thermoleophilaceae bacterium]|nr:PIN domain-containing protein [Thermoleophilaceae bacterium]